MSSIDDIFIDVYYWILTVYRKLFVYTKYKKMMAEDLYKKEQCPIALMSPAWDEPAVIGKMVKRCIEVYDYDNFHIFIGTYPNDPATQAAVDEVVAIYPNVHKVVGPKEGPTTKAQCLNSIINEIFNFEKKNGVYFEGICYHDAEDVIHPLELRFFNHLIERNDLIQLPVMPQPRKWYDWIGNHYMDEFAEVHTKDIVVREHFCGEIPSAGVATAFSRRAINKLSELNDGQVFDESTLTEDYNIGYYLKEAGMKEIFARLTLRYDKNNKESVEKFGKMEKLICSGGLFPNNFIAAFRQKARWSTGIIFQARKKIGLPQELKLRYMLLHDRKGVITNFIPILGYFIMVNIIIMELAHRFIPDAWIYPDLVPFHSYIWYLLLINGVFLINRIVQRFIFTSINYGFLHGILSFPRSIVANMVNFFAMARSIKLVHQSKKNGTQVKWDKTAHEDEEDSN